jgi:hypothetical protein
MLYPDNDIVVKVYNEPLYIIQFRRWITYEGVGVSRGVCFRVEDLYTQLTRVMYSHNAHIVTTMVHSTGLCRYVFPFSIPINPQDPENFTRDETQGQRGYHTHVPLYNVQMDRVYRTLPQGMILGGNPNEG